MRYTLLLFIGVLWYTFAVETKPPACMYYFEQQHTVNKPIEYPSQAWQDEERGWHPGGHR